MAVGVKDGAKRFLGGIGQTEVHQPPGFRNIFYAIAALDVYECILAVKPGICIHVPLLCAGGTIFLLLLLNHLCVLYE